mmetsp:Transcript_5507/g.13451  ORF Transcript_5507/g.13451 Transcript_5507/m.13451 type:complete len:209 (-) Transcript_5507:1762-2388(-)
MVFLRLHLRPSVPHRETLQPSPCLNLPIHTDGRLRLLRQSLDTQSFPAASAAPVEKSRAVPSSLPLLFLSRPHAASDPSLPIRSPAGFVGEYNCGTRLEVLQSALEAVGGHARPDVVVWTGDNAPHHEGTTREDVLATFKAVTRELQQRLPGVAVVPSLGNYDFVPVHSDPGPPLNSWLLGPLAELFSDWIGDEGLSTFRFAGYYDVW